MTMAFILNTPVEFPREEEEEEGQIPLTDEQVEELYGNDNGVVIVERDESEGHVILQRMGEGDNDIIAQMIVGGCTHAWEFSANGRVVSDETLEDANRCLTAIWEARHERAPLTHSELECIARTLVGLGRGVRGTGADVIVIDEAAHTPIEGLLEREMSNYNNNEYDQSFGRRGRHPTDEELDEEREEIVRQYPGAVIQRHPEGYSTIDFSGVYIGRVMYLRIMAQTTERADPEFVEHMANLLEQWHQEGDPNEPKTRDQLIEAVDREMDRYYYIEAGVEENNNNNNDDDRLIDIRGSFTTQLDRTPPTPRSIARRQRAEELWARHFEEEDQNQEGGASELVPFEGGPIAGGYFRQMSNLPDSYIDDIPLPPARSERVQDPNSRWILPTNIRGDYLRTVPAEPMRPSYNTRGNSFNDDDDNIFYNDAAMHLSPEEQQRINEQMLSGEIPVYIGHDRTQQLTRDQVVELLRAPRMAEGISPEIIERIMGNNNNNNNNNNMEDDSGSSCLEEDDDDDDEDDSNSSDDDEYPHPIDIDFPLMDANDGDVFQIDLPLERRESRNEWSMEEVEQVNQRARLAAVRGEEEEQEIIEVNPREPRSPPMIRWGRPDPIFEHQFVTDGQGNVRQQEQQQQRPQSIPQQQQPSSSSPPIILSRGYHVDRMGRPEVFERSIMDFAGAVEMKPSGTSNGWRVQNRHNTEYTSGFTTPKNITEIVNNSKNNTDRQSFRRAARESRSIQPVYRVPFPPHIDPKTGKCGRTHVRIFHEMSIKNAKLMANNPFSICKANGVLLPIEKLKDIPKELELMDCEDLYIAEIEIVRVYHEELDDCRTEAVWAPSKDDADDAIGFNGPLFMANGDVFPDHPLYREMYVKPCEDMFRMSPATREQYQSVTLCLFRSNMMKSDAYRFVYDWRAFVNDNDDAAEVSKYFYEADIKGRDTLFQLLIGHPPSAVYLANRYMCYKKNKASIPSWTSVALRVLMRTIVPLMGIAEKKYDNVPLSKPYGEQILLILGINASIDWDFGVQEALLRHNEERSMAMMDEYDLPCFVGIVKEEEEEKAITFCGHENFDFHDESTPIGEYDDTMLMYSHEHGHVPKFKGLQPPVSEWNAFIASERFIRSGISTTLAPCWYMADGTAIRLPANAQEAQEQQQRLQQRQHQQPQSLSSEWNVFMGSKAITRRETFTMSPYRSLPDGSNSRIPMQQQVVQEQEEESPSTHIRRAMGRPPSNSQPSDTFHMYNYNTATGETTLIEPPTPQPQQQEQVPQRYDGFGTSLSPSSIAIASEMVTYPTQSSEVLFGHWAGLDDNQHVDPNGGPLARGIQ